MVMRHFSVNHQHPSCIHTCTYTYIHRPTQVHTHTQITHTFRYTQAIHTWIYASIYTYKHNCSNSYICRPTCIKGVFGGLSQGGWNVLGKCPIEPHFVILFLICRFFGRFECTSSPLLSLSLLGLLFQLSMTVCHHPLQALSISLSLFLNGPC